MGTTTVIYLIAIGLMAGVFGGIFGVGGQSFDEKLLQSF
jgi:hypothetical protein